MKATLEFDLPEEREEHEVAVHAMDWHLCVWDIAQWLRSKLKFGHDFENAKDALEAARDYLYVVMEDRGAFLE